MARYRKKPVVIEAENFWPGEIPWPQGVERINRHESDPTSQTGFRIETPDGWVAVTPGDWIIIGVKDDHYPCKPDIFAETYEKVDDDA